MGPDSVGLASCALSEIDPALLLEYHTNYTDYTNYTDHIYYTPPYLTAPTLLATY